MGFRKNQRTTLEQVRRTLLMAVASERARLPIQREVVEGGLIRARYDAVSLAAFFGSIGHPVKVENAQRLLQKLPPNSETALGEVPDAGG